MIHDILYDLVWSLRGHDKGCIAGVGYIWILLLHRLISTTIITIQSLFTLHASASCLAVHRRPPLTVSCLPKFSASLPVQAFPIGPALNTSHHPKNLLSSHLSTHGAGSPLLKRLFCQSRNSLSKFVPSFVIVSWTFKPASILLGE